MARGDAPRWLTDSERTLVISRLVAAVERSHVIARRLAVNDGRAARLRARAEQNRWGSGRRRTNGIVVTDGYMRFGPEGDSDTAPPEHGFACPIKINARSSARIPDAKCFDRNTKRRRAFRLKSLPRLYFGTGADTLS